MPLCFPINGWDDATAALQLLSHLEGEALNVALLLPASRRASQIGLVAALSAHYGSSRRLADYRRQFEKTTRKSGESREKPSWGVSENLRKSPAQEKPSSGKAQLRKIPAREFRESREKPGSGVRIVSGKARQCRYVSGIARQRERGRVIITAGVLNCIFM